MAELDLDAIEARAKAALEYDWPEDALPELKQTAREDVPALCAEVRKLQFEVETNHVALELGATLRIDLEAQMDRAQAAEARVHELQAANLALAERVDTMRAERAVLKSQLTMAEHQRDDETNACAMCRQRSESVRPHLPSDAREQMLKVKAALLDARLPAKAGVGSGVANLTIAQVDLLIDLMNEACE